MGWIIAILVIRLAIAGLVGGAVLHPLLYGLFIASILIVPLWLRVFDRLRHHRCDLRKEAIGHRVCKVALRACRYNYM